jgi:transcriptional regulator with XRE-family HTH domain
MDWTPETLGPWLRKMRDLSGLSLDALGERVGRTRQQLIDYEKGRRDPGGAVLMRILQELGARIEAPVEPPDVKSVSDELIAMATVIDALKAAVEMQGIGAAATAQAIEMLRRQRNGEPVPAADLVRVADALGAAIREYEALAEDLRAASRAVKPT